jgi:renalase
VSIAVIGAGLAGLVAARGLVADGHDVVVFEKSRGVGGRIASRRVAGTVVDHGIPALWSDGPLRALAEDLDLPPEPIDLPVVGSHADLPSSPPFAYPEGLTALAKRLAAELEVRKSVRIATFRRVGSEWELGDEQGNGHGVFSGVVLAAPVPQTVELLRAAAPDDPRIGLLGDVAYDPALVVIAGVSRDAEPSFFGLRRPDARPVVWVGVESAKGRPPADGATPVVVHLDAVTSRDLFEASDGEIASLATAELSELLGGGAAGPRWTQVKRWRYAVPARRLGFSEVNPTGADIVICGDGVAGEPGLDAVVRSGQEAARAISARHSPRR